MAIPVIFPSISMLVFQQGQYFEFQPAATPPPFEWSALGLPEGLGIDEETGLISGSSMGMGVYDITLTASNVDGTSAPFIFPLVLTPGEGKLDEAIEVDIDLTSGIASNEYGTGDESPLFFAKDGDVLVLSVGFKKGDTLQNLALTTLSFALKEFAGEQTLVLNDGAFSQSTTGNRFKIMVPFDRQKLAPVLTSYEKNRSTDFDAIAEIEWTWQHEGIGDDEPAILRRSTQNFRVRCGKDFIEG